jgi:hypothetical protein
MMGERVVINPSRFDDPGPQPKRAVPLGYGHEEDRMKGAWRATAGFREQTDIAAQRLGGWRRVGFALGLAFVLAGFAYGMSNIDRCDGAAMLAGAGGLLIGLVVPIKGLGTDVSSTSSRRDDSPRQRS